MITFATSDPNLPDDSLKAAAYKLRLVARYLAEMKAAYYGCTSNWSKRMLREAADTRARLQREYEKLLYKAHRATMYDYFTHTRDRGLLLFADGCVFLCYQEHESWRSTSVIKRLTTGEKWISISYVLALESFRNNVPPHDIEH